MFSSSCSMTKKKKFCMFKFPFQLTGRYKEQATSTFVQETDVSQEYHQAFRTNSYMEICNKVQNHICLDNGSSIPSSSIRDHYIHKCDILLEAQNNETMANLAKTFDIHFLILDFFGAGLEAWKTNEKLLHSIHQANANQHRIKRAIKTAERAPKSDQRATVYNELALYASLSNPLLDFSPETFQNLHKQLSLLLNRLTTIHTRIKRKRKLIIFMKSTMGCALVASYTVLAIALVVLAFHGLVGIVASPALITCLFGLTKKANKANKRLKTDELKRVSMLLDVAAKGIYTLIKDFDTIASLTSRLHNEVEFGRIVARNCVGIKLKPDVSEEVMREFRVHDSRFTEQVEELKDHIYLCLLNVNRSRRLLVEEIMPCSYKGS
ncbi:hypothetical protein CTI12_AA311640 [Artemisia annua]|uniref:Uncharacterized protein n=1 Tax=Artemisia annua TaxID=35608 RepID=A0A2U1MAF9_ARTAN|nr:hypothetical protein CTI12_AA311640 [Artemisia annua]